MQEQPEATEITQNIYGASLGSSLGGSVSSVGDNEPRITGFEVLAPFREILIGGTWTGDNGKNKHLRKQEQHGQRHDLYKPSTSLLVESLL